MTHGQARVVNELHDRQLHVHGLLHRLLHGHGRLRGWSLLRRLRGDLIPVHPQRFLPRGTAGDGPHLPREEGQDQDEEQRPDVHRRPDRAVRPPDGQQHRGHVLAPELANGHEPVVEVHRVPGARGGGGGGLEDAEGVADLAGALRQVRRHLHGLRKVRPERRRIHRQPRAQQDVAVSPQRPQGARDAGGFQFAPGSEQVQRQQRHAQSHLEGLREEAIADTADKARLPRALDDHRQRHEEASTEGLVLEAHLEARAPVVENVHTEVDAGHLAEDEADGARLLHVLPLGPGFSVCRAEGAGVPPLE
mmetsp:Transcript_50332/g.155968  ORF Transcript_50332/g.155968 Transcript_50332/m.155968 type:complete len:306 (-) Transcript_50332:570-1487(-)